MEGDKITSTTSKGCSQSFCMIYMSLIVVIDLACTHGLQPLLKPINKGGEFVLGEILGAYNGIKNYLACI